MVTRKKQREKKQQQQTKQDRQDKHLSVQDSPSLLGVSREGQTTEEFRATPEKETPVQMVLSPTKRQLVELIDKNPLDEMAAIADEVRPTVNSLPEKAIDFITGMLMEHSDSGSVHLRAELLHFVPLCTTMRTATLAKCKIGDTYPFCLHYFALGDGVPTEKTGRTVKIITEFLGTPFGKQEQKGISECVNRARSVFITTTRKKEAVKTRGEEVRGRVQTWRM